jgi:hypothetical protein
MEEMNEMYRTCFETIQAVQVAVGKFRTTRWFSQLLPVMMFLLTALFFATPVSASYSNNSRNTEQLIDIFGEEEAQKIMNAPANSYIGFDSRTGETTIHVIPQPEGQPTPEPVFDVPLTLVDSPEGLERWEPGVDAEHVISLELFIDGDATGIHEDVEGIGFGISNSTQSMLQYLPNETLLLKKFDGIWYVVSTATATFRESEIMIPTSMTKYFSISFSDYDHKPSPGHYAAAVYCKDRQEDIFSGLCDFYVVEVGDMRAMSKWNEEVIPSEAITIKTEYDVYPASIDSLNIVFTNMTDDNVYPTLNSWTMLKMIDGEWYKIPLSMEPSNFYSVISLFEIPPYEQKVHTVAYKEAFAHNFSDGHYALYLGYHHFTGMPKVLFCEFDVDSTLTVPRNAG